MTLAILADIGGTNTRVALAEGTQVRIDSIRRFPNADYQARGQDIAQVLRDYLDVALASTGVAPHVAGVSVRLEIVTQELAIRRDETPGRARLSATALYVATPRVAQGAPEPTPLRGTVYVIEGYNFVDTQFFATDSSRDAAERRLMQQAAEEIARRLMVLTAAGS